MARNAIEADKLIKARERADHGKPQRDEKSRPPVAEAVAGGCDDDEGRRGRKGGGRDGRNCR